MNELVVCPVSPHPWPPSFLLPIPIVELIMLVVLLFFYSFYLGHAGS